MGEPIVSPVFIYMINLVNNIVIVATVILVFSSMGFVLTRIGAAVCLAEYDKDDDDYKKWKSAYKLLFIPVMITVIIVVFVPDKSTILQMYVADKITFERVEQTVKMGKSLKDEIKNDIIEILEAIDKEEK